MTNTVELVAAPTNFQLVSQMNSAFGNPKGDPSLINWERVRNQSVNVFDEFIELQVALGLCQEGIDALKSIRRILAFLPYGLVLNTDKVRDALCDINVFSYGAHHLMGIDADRDMESVVRGVMTRFIKDEQDKQATVARHAAKGVTDVYFEGEYPTMIMKSASDQPDAPKGKFLKSASFKEPVFYTPV